MPMMQLIDKKLLKETDNDTQLTKDIKQRIKQDLWNDTRIQSWER